MTKNNHKKILLSPPHMTGNELHYIQEAFDTNWVAPLGPNVEAFEKQLTEYTGTAKTLATSSGTAAIHLALDVLGVQKEDRVMCQSFTFVASANPIRYLGAEPVFIDSEPETWNMCPEALERALVESEEKGQLPKAILVVHLYGQSAKMRELLEVANRFNVPIVEDAAESLGSKYESDSSGTHGAMGIYSFNGNKIITTSGGGALVSHDADYIDRAHHLATQAKDPAPHYQHSTLGYNYRMSNLSAGVGRAQLEALDDRVRKRREIFERYKNKLGSLPGVHFLTEYSGTFSNRWLSTFLLDPGRYRMKPVDLVKKLEEEGIEARLLWKPLHLQPLYTDSPFYTALPYQKAICEDLFETGVCLPSGSNMSEEEQTRVIRSISRLLLASDRHRHVPAPAFSKALLAGRKRES